MLRNWPVSYTKKSIISLPSPKSILLQQSKQIIIFRNFIYKKLLKKQKNIDLSIGKFINIFFKVKKIGVDHLGYLILVRHGESRWNIANKFTGWVDVPLSEVGVHEAMITAKNLENVKIDVAFTSKLVRAHETLLLILAEQKNTGIFLHSSHWRKLWSLHYGRKEFEENEIPIHSSDRLNERYYGSLQGMNKDFAREKWGEEQVHIWRRSYSVRPPSGESLKDVYKRAVPYFKNKIMKHVKANQNVIVSAHGNSLRAIIKYIDNISDADIPNLELQTGKPIIYEYKNNKLVKINHEHFFDRPINWTATSKHKKTHANSTKVLKIKKSLTKSKKKIPNKKTISKKKSIKKSRPKKAAKKVVKKNTSAKKKAIKKTPSKKKTLKKTVKKKIAPKKVTKKKVAGRKPTNNKKTTRKKTTNKKRR